MNLFFHPELSSDHIELDLDESRHVKAMRQQDGDAITLTDGKGQSVVGVLTWKKHIAQIVVHERTSHGPSSENITLVMAPTKQHERMEWLLEKAVELGIAAVYFIQCANSERPVVRMDRLHRVAIAAIKQCQRYHLPVLHEVQKMDALYQSFSSHTNVLAHCRMDVPRTPIGQHLTSDPIGIWIGPEGDFHPNEIEMALQHNFVSVSLGQARLRTETAALAAIAAIQMNRI